MRLSRGFLAALGGVGMTLLAWFGSWVWPGWPASFAMDVIERYASFPDFPRGLKVVTIIGLIAINVGTWGLILREAMQIVRRR